MNIIIILIAFILGIVILSLPMYFASLLIVNKDTTGFGNAILSTILTAFILIVVPLLLRFFIGPFAGAFIVFIIAFVVLILLYIWFNL